VPSAVEPTTGARSPAGRPAPCTPGVYRLHTHSNAARVRPAWKALVTTSTVRQLRGMACTHRHRQQGPLPPARSVSVRSGHAARVSTIHAWRVGTLMYKGVMAHQTLKHYKPYTPSSCKTQIPNLEPLPGIMI